MKNYVIDETVRHAIIDCIEAEYKFNNAFARKLSVHPSLVGEWIKKRTPDKYINVKAPLYEKLFKLIERYIKDVEHKPDETPMTGGLIAHPSSDCPEICKGLGDLEKNLLKNYLSLDVPRRTELFKKWSDDFQQAQKKSVFKPPVLDNPGKSDIGRNAS